MLRIAHFADLHLGLDDGRVGRGGRPARVVDVLDRFDEFCAWVEDNDVHAVVFAGDAFDRPTATPTIQQDFAERIRRLTRTAGVFLLVGNHDLPQSQVLQHPMGIYDALEVPGVVVGDRAGLFEVPLPERAPVPVLQVGALPHYRKQALLERLSGQLPEDEIERSIRSEISRVQQETAASVDPTLPAVHCAHLHVVSATVGAQERYREAEFQVSLSDLCVGGAFQYYALGHIHQQQLLAENPHVAYPGSIERVDFGEGEKWRVEDGKATVTKPGEAKGFSVVDLERRDGGWHLADHRFIQTAARRFVSIRIDCAGEDDPTGAALSALKLIGDDFATALVKIQLVTEAEDRARVDVPSVAAALPLADSVRITSATTETRRTEDDRRYALANDPITALGVYLDAHTDLNADRDELLKRAQQLLEEVG